MTDTTHPFDALMEITARPPVVFVRGAGSYLWDDSRKRYLDFVQGWAVNALGHSPPAVAEALAAQAKLLLTPSPAFYNGPSLKLAKALVEKSCFDQVFFANSGAEANEGAIKLARKYGAKYKNGAFEIITFEGGFHGRTLATMSASGKKAFEPLFEPKVSGFRKAKLNDLDSVRTTLTAWWTALPCSLATLIIVVARRLASARVPWRLTCARSLRGMLQAVAAATRSSSCS